MFLSSKPQTLTEASVEVYHEPGSPLALQGTGVSKNQLVPGIFQQMTGRLVRISTPETRVLLLPCEGFCESHRSPEFFVALDVVVTRHIREATIADKRG